MNHIDNAEIIYQTPKFELIFLSSINSILVKWIGFSTKEEVITCMKKITETVKERKITKAIFDNRHLSNLNILISDI